MIKRRYLTQLSFTSVNVFIKTNTASRKIASNTADQQVFTEEEGKKPHKQSKSTVLSVRSNISTINITVIDSDSFTCEGLP